MITVNQQKIELGTLKFGVSHSFDYSLSNLTSEVITINKLTLGCNSCTKASVSKSTINPGETIQLNVTFTPGSTGNQLKAIDVKYDTNKHLDLKFTAKVDA